tara:strand:+ start:2122 stop:3162 length:1041 start_codon:yes stop_codon:yes gene_type:complete
MNSLNIQNLTSTFIIAELSANHNQDFNIALETVKAAKEVGADAIKLQTYTADTLTLNCRKDYFKLKGTLWNGQYLHDLYQQAYTPWAWHKEIMDYAQSLGLICFSSPFDFSAIDFLETLDVPAYKIASPEIVDIPLIKYAASKGKPMILSTGLATLDEIEDAIQACRDTGNQDIALLKCTSSYPTPLEEVNLRTMVDFKTRFECEIGLSDHTLGHLVATNAVALGAKIVEKHFILDKNLGGPDAEFSLDKTEFKTLVDQIRATEKILGSVTYELTEKMKNARQFKRSLFVTKDIQAGEVLTAEHVRSVRPGYGMSPKYLDQVIGKKVTQNISFGEPLAEAFLETSQ